MTRYFYYFVAFGWLPVPQKRLPNVVNKPSWLLAPARFGGAPLPKHSLWNNQKVFYGGGGEQPRVTKNQVSLQNYRIKLFLINAENYHKPIKIN